jgi:hypothetical protein
MREQFAPFAEPSYLADAILTSEEPDAWTLDELHDSADLGSLRSAWTSTDDPIF